MSSSVMGDKCRCQTNHRGQESDWDEDDLDTIRPPRPEDFDLAAMSGVSEGERLRKAMDVEQETPEPFYDGDEPA